MTTDNDSHSDVLSEISTMIDTMYLNLMKKRLAMAEFKKNKTPDLEDKEMEIDNLQETFDGICKTHRTYMGFRKQSGMTSQKNQKESQEELTKLLQAMKSNMGDIVSTVPRN